MGCYDQGSGGNGGDDIVKDLAKKASASQPGAGGVSDWRSTFGSLFRARRYLDSSTQAHIELPDPLFRAPAQKTPFIFTRRG